MTTLIIPNTLQISAHMLQGGQDIYNVFHFKYPDATFPDPAALLASFKASYEATGGVHKLRPNTCSMVEYRLVDLSSPTGAVATLGSSATGNSVTQSSPLSNAVVVKLTSGTRSRSGAGRVFHGPLVTTDIGSDGRTILTATKTAIETAYRKLQTDMNAVNATLVVASRKNLNTTTVLQINAAPIMATQRRRLR